jgi:hypothetical protein
VSGSRLPRSAAPARLRDRARQSGRDARRALVAALPGPATRTLGDVAIGSGTAGGVLVFGRRSSASRPGGGDGRPPTGCGPLRPRGAGPDAVHGGRQLQHRRRRSSVLAGVGPLVIVGGIRVSVHRRRLTPSPREDARGTAARLVCGARSGRSPSLANVKDPLQRLPAPSWSSQHAHRYRVGFVNRFTQRCDSCNDSRAGAGERGGLVRIHSA